MKILLSLTTLALALGSISCRTSTPLDPMTMEPSVHCLPGAQVTTVYATK